MDWFSYFCAIYFLFSLLAFKKWHDLSRARKSRKTIAWSIVGDYNPSLSRYSFVEDQVDSLYYAQRRLEIDRSYWLLNDEISKIRDIISSFQLSRSREYFLGKLSAVDTKSNFCEVDNFMLDLYTFLCDTHCESDDVLLSKLKYITCVYCCRNDSLSKFVPSWTEGYLLEALKDAINKRDIQ